MQWVSGRERRLRQHGVTTLFTRDRDFRRYDFLTVIDPLEGGVRERRRSRYRQDD